MGRIYDVIPKNKIDLSKIEVIGRSKVIGRSNIDPSKDQVGIRYYTGPLISFDIASERLKKMLSDTKETITSEISRSIIELLKTRTLTRVDLTSLVVNDFAIGNNKNQITVSILKKYFKQIPAIVSTDISDNDADAILLNQNTNHIPDVMVLRGNISAIDVCRWNGTTFVLVIQRQPDWSGSSQFPKSIVLYTTKRKKDLNNTHRFINTMKQETYEFYKKTLNANSEEKSNTITIRNHTTRRSVSRDVRTFDELYYDDKLKNDIMNTIKTFKDSRDWYTKRKIPYHLGIMLYGPPGTGKTSIAKAIAADSDAHCLQVFSSIDFKEFYNIFEDHDEDETMIVLFEDIDCSKVTRSRNSKTYTDAFDLHEKSKDDDDDNHSDNSLSEFLNAIDGASAPNNVIYIFTSNRPDVLDEAMLRKGRIDKMFEIPYATKSALEQFFKVFYEQKVDLSNVNIRKDIIFPDLQMNFLNMTVQEMLDYITDHENES